MKNITIFSFPLSILVHTESIWSLIILTKENNMIEHTSGYWIFQAISFITSIVFITWVITKFKYLYNKIEAHSLINDVRTYNLYLEQRSHIKHKILPNESEESFRSRSHEAEYIRQLFSEKESLTVEFAKKCNLTINEAEKIMNEIYNYKQEKQ